MSLNSPKNGIVPEFQSGTQISQSELLKFRISQIQDKAARQTHELAFLAAEQRVSELDGRLVRAETGYINRHLDLRPRYQPTPYGNQDSYEDRAQELGKSFRESHVAKSLQERIAAAEERTWDRRIKSVNQQLKIETDKPVSREAFFKMRDTPKDSPSLSPTFRRATDRSI
ncbi:hypothetical protein [Primorskyibacter flagellatus]|uniref:hypothetical protein n=1 Tax=Primorskyibacter flagellatus TaxID=1387277 RepID=UPI0009FD2D6B|nr:hypothetical protein [Primorskyibacter flagellatus]